MAALQPSPPPQPVHHESHMTSTPVTLTSSVGVRHRSRGQSVLVASGLWSFRRGMRLFPHTPDGKWEFLNPQPACLLNSDNRSTRWLPNANVSAGRFSIRSGDNKPCGHTDAPETIGMGWGCGGGRGQRKSKDTSSNPAIYQRLHCKETHTHT